MKLAIGTAQFGLDYGIANTHGQIPLAEATAIVERARRAGIDTIDTAIAYGESEARLGEIGVDGWRVVSKLPAVPENCSDIGAWVHAGVDASLQRLQQPRLYALLLHQPDQLLQPVGAALVGALAELKAAGRVGKVGLSIYDPAKLPAYLECLDADVIQAPLNVMDRRIIQSGWASRLRDRGVEVHVRSVFLQGLLLMEARRRPREFERWKATFDAWDRWLEESGETPLEACMRFALTAPGIDRVVVGIDSLEHLRQILAVDVREVTLPDTFACADPNLVNPSTWPRAS